MGLASDLAAPHVATTPATCVPGLLGTFWPTGNITCMLLLVSVFRSPGNWGVSGSPTGTLCVPASLGRSSVTPSRPSKQATGTWTRAGTILQQSPQPLGIPARGPRAHTCQALLLLAWQAQSVLPPRLTSSCSRPLPALPEANASLGPRGCKGKPSGIRQLGPHNKTRDGSLEQRKLIFSQFWIKASAGLFFFFSWRPLSWACPRLSAPRLHVTVPLCLSVP